MLQVAFFVLLSDPVAITSEKTERPRTEPSAALLLQRGYGFARRNNWEAALADVNQAIEADPNQAHAWALLGKIHLHVGEPEIAIRAFSVAITLDASEPSFFYQRGAAFRLGGQIDKCIADQNEALRLDPICAVAFLNRGAGFCDKGDLEKASRDFDKALELNAKLALAYSNRGIVFEKKGLLAKAIEDYSKAIEISPMDPVYLYNRGCCFCNKKDFNNALADFKKALHEGGFKSMSFASAQIIRSRIHEKCGHIYYDKRLPREALKNLDSSIEFDPKNATSLAIRASIYCDLAHDAESLADCARLSQLNPKQSRPFLLRGTIFGRRGECDKAIEELTKAISLADDASEERMDALSKRGYLLRKRGDLQGALSDYEALAKLDPLNTVWRELCTAVFLELHGKK